MCVREREEKRERARVSVRESVCEREKRKRARACVRESVCV